MYPSDYRTPLTKIAFGSCNKQNGKWEPLWDKILATQPQLWIWLGDNVYLRSEENDTNEQKVTKLEDAYTDLNQLDYKKFREQIPIIGTWDDHDYGGNNSKKENPFKVKSQKLALNFLEEPVKSIRRTREGIFYSYEFGPLDKKVKILLTDTRYHADEPGEKAELLGEEQWQWLKKELLNSDAQLKIIGSSIQVLPEDHGHAKWARYPRERDKLLYFIRMNDISGVVFLSGDRHLHEISIKNDKETNYPLAEATSSGLTHYYKEFPGERNRYRFGKVLAERGFGMLLIDWNDAATKVILQIRNKNNQVVNEATLRLDQLSP